MDHTDHALIVPPVGILQILHGVQDPEQALRDQFPHRPAYVNVGFHITGPDEMGEGGEGHLGYFPGLDTHNLRARETLRILTGIHMVLTGPVIFTGVDAPRLGHVVAILARYD